MFDANLDGDRYLVEAFCYDVPVQAMGDVVVATVDTAIVVVVVLAFLLVDLLCE